MFIKHGGHFICYLAGIHVIRLLGGSVVKNPLAIVGFDPRVGDSGRRKWYSCLENSMDRDAWQATVHGVAKNQTQLSDLDNNNKYIQSLTVIYINYGMLSIR